MTTEAKKAAGYIRASTKQQVEAGAFLAGARAGA